VFIPIGLDALTILGMVRLTSFGIVENQAKQLTMFIVISCLFMA
jgi:hypothetical protein